MQSFDVSSFFMRKNICQFFFLMCIIFSSHFQSVFKRKKVYFSSLYPCLLKIWQELFWCEMLRFAHFSTTNLNKIGLMGEKISKRNLAKEFAKSSH